MKAKLPNEPNCLDVQKYGLCITHKCVAFHDNELLPIRLHCFSTTQKTAVGCPRSGMAAFLDEEIKKSKKEG